MNPPPKSLHTLLIILLPVVVMITLVVLIGMLTNAIRDRVQPATEPVASFTVIVEGNPLLAKKLESMLNELLQSQDEPPDVTLADRKASVTGQPVARPMVVLDI